MGSDFLGHGRQDSSQRPGIPPQGIPPRRTPEFLRKALKIFVLPWMLLDLLMQRLIQRIWPPPYKVLGGCKQRGNCCHYILMERSPAIERWTWLQGFWDWWYTDIHGFYERGYEVESPDGRVAKVMSCRYLRADGRCGQYRVRPALCRQWPRIEYTKRPHLLKGCGYLIEMRTTPEDEPTNVPTREEEQKSP
jgi:Fe-S-cluster containining protein